MNLTKEYVKRTKPFIDEHIKILNQGIHEFENNLEIPRDELRDTAKNMVEAAKQLLDLVNNDPPNEPWCELTIRKSTENQWHVSIQWEADSNKDPISCLGSTAECEQFIKKETGNNIKLPS